MKKLTLLLLLASSMAYGQRNLNIEETVFGPRTYAPANIVNSNWIPNSNNFSYLDKSYQNLVQKTASSNWSEQILLSKADLQTALQTKLPNEQINLSYFPIDYKWENANTINFTLSTKQNQYYIAYDIKNKTVAHAISSDVNGTNQEYAGDYSKVAFLIGNNINIKNADGKLITVTDDTTDGIVNGSDYTHRQEFGIKKGMWWNSQNDKLLYYRKDETMVTKYPLIQWDTRTASVKDIRYPMAGMKSEEVTLVIYDTKNGQKITLATGESKEQFLTQVTWDPSGAFIYVGVLNREQNHLKLNKYSAQDGSLVKTLFEETATTWVEPQTDLVFLPNNPKQFLYQSDKEGFNQLYLYDTDGKLVKKLGYENLIVHELGDFSSKGDKITYTGVTNNGLDRQLFEVDLKSGKTTQLTQDTGTHQAKLNGDGTYVLDQYSNLTTPNVVQVKAVKSGKIDKVITAENPFLGKINPPKIEFITLTSADGVTPLTGRIIYPNDFDPNKKYPVMYYLYGGSHSQLVSNKWLGAAGYFDLYMAQQGYIVFTMDNRGTDARGRAFSTATHRQLGQAEMADQMKGIEYLKSKSFVDQGKMGIFGWSFGGFMTTSFMVHHNDIFKAAVAGGPVIDWKYYEVMYGERYMDMPQENAEGYKLTSLIDKADQLKGDLLIIHGAQDPVVVQQNSMEFVEACIKAGKQVDYFLYPTHEHNVSGKDRIHMYEKIAKYFDLHLKK
ncbi:S9 family peptidase [Sphingobacterium sp. SRCM116780]|uniref:S9 family peptidase n=1 Tax=Sphingobacterium sp. SRCM116780 TaxID=2907623 RepID=UPI001F39ABC1|nr:DPP IV N-terminal domain-containing protein [Sphingobacterium sp. SRCM116780]UIR56829.1 S9 family peptidase [Sphingobacterium sp. SRCM116780]